MEREIHQIGANSVADREQREERAVDHAERAQAEIAADEEGHEIDLGADAEAAEHRGDEGYRAARPCRQERDADHGAAEEGASDIGTMDAVEGPARNDAANR